MAFHGGVELSEHQTSHRFYHPHPSCAWPFKYWVGYLKFVDGSIHIFTATASKGEVIFKW